MLLAAREAYGMTGGRTNVAMGSVLRIWHEYRMSGLEDPENAATPSMESLLEAARFASWNDVIIDEEGGTVFLTRPEMALDVGAVAKGYGAGLAMEAAMEAGLRTALLNAGGHVVTIGEPPGREHWNVAVQNPVFDADGVRDTVVDVVAMTGVTVSVSGAYQRFYIVNGLPFGHLIDPQTLMPANRFLQVAVIHPLSWMADVISTALFILPQEEGMALAGAVGAEAFWIDLNGDGFATPGYARLSSVFE
jgi:thiamine biosynthesis lipoprotein